MLCARCTAVFAECVNPRPYEPFNLFRWGDYNHLHQANDHGCVLCQDVRKNLLDQGVDLAAKPPRNERLNRGITFSIGRSDLSFHAENIHNPNLPIPTPKGSSYQLSTLHDSPWHAFFPKRPLSIDSSSDECFLLAGWWMKTCLESHDICPKNFELLPRRVIDVGTATQDPFLLRTNGTQRGHWVTLSHCWGDYHTITTTSVTLDAHCRSLRMDDLPQTFRDAVSITRRLGYQYLWIDSLCIIQDSQEDWDAESKVMAAIYMHAILNISADGSRDDDEGIFKSIATERPRYDHLVLPCAVTQHTTATNVEGNVYAVPLLGDYCSNLQQRGWVLQESVLSPRKLRYTRDGLKWVCAHASGSESRCHMMVGNKHRGKDRKSIAHDVPWSQALPDRPTRSQLHDRRADEQLRWWYTRLNDFVGRKLSFSKDRLPAVLGLADFFSQQTGYTFKEGIWLQDFPRGLLWKGTTSEEYLTHFPSWSWAAVELRDYWGLYDFKETRVRGQWYNAELEDIVVEEESVNARVSHGSLNLVGYAQPFTTFCTEVKFSAGFVQRSTSEEFTPTTSYITDADRLKAHEIWLSTPLVPEFLQLILDDRKAIVFRLADFTASESLPDWSTYFLIVEPFQERKNTYQRLGLMRTPIGSTDESSRKLLIGTGFELARVQII